MASAVPKYRIIKDHVMRDIARQGENQLLPSENQLARTFNVSRMTARRALAELEREGYARRVPGKGTFSRKRHYTQGFFRVHSFHRYAQSLNATPRITVLRSGTATPPPEVAERLACTTAIFMCRLLYADDDLVSFENRYLPKELCPGILRENLTGESINAILLERYGLPTTRVWQRLEAVGLTGEVAAFFNVAENHPAFRLERLSYSFDRPIGWVEYFRRGDAYAFEDTFHPQQESVTGFSDSKL